MQKYIYQISATEPNHDFLQPAFYATFEEAQEILWNFYTKKLPKFFPDSKFLWYGFGFTPKDQLKGIGQPGYMIKKIGLIPELPNTTELPILTPIPEMTKSKHPAIFNIKFMIPLQFVDESEETDDPELDVDDPIHEFTSSEELLNAASKMAVPYGDVFHNDYITTLPLNVITTDKNQYALIMGSNEVSAQDLEEALNWMRGQTSDGLLENGIGFMYNNKRYRMWPTVDEDEIVIYHH